MVLNGTSAWGRAVTRMVLCAVRSDGSVVNHTTPLARGSSLRCITSGGAEPYAPARFRASNT